MRKRGHVIFVAVLAIAIASMSAAIGYAAAVHTAATATSGSTKASLKIVKFGPVTVQGRHFSADMRVKTTFRSPSHDVVHFRKTDRHGAFTVVFNVTPDRCTGFTITAHQRNGTTAVIHGPHTECAPMSTQ